MPKKDRNDEVVYELSRAARCYNCDRKLLVGDLVTVVIGESSEYSDEKEREVRCSKCAGLEQMQVVKPGNAKLTRLAKKYSKESYVIMRWSELWKTYERKGILAEPLAIEKANSEIQKDSSK
jgi:hypothetical protein